MRTIFLPNVDAQISEITLIDDDAFHLERVVRSKVGDQIQINNGQGLSLQSSIIQIKKNSIQLKIDNQKFHAKKTHLSLLCGRPKKSTCEEIIRLATELGLAKVYFWDSEFAQPGELSPNRIDSILKNAMEQSNNYWLPEIYFQKNISADFFNQFEEIVIFHNHNSAKNEKLELKSNNVLFVVGPEGGLSVQDIQKLSPLKTKPFSVALPTPIMTTPTAICCALGFLVQHSNQHFSTVNEE